MQVHLINVPSDVAATLVISRLRHVSLVVGVGGIGRGTGKYSIRKNIEEKLPNDSILIATELFLQSIVYRRRDESNNEKHIDDACSPWAVTMRLCFYN